MKFEVIWIPSAVQELAAIWLQASDRQAVTTAAHAIEKRLESDPENDGESRPKGRRILHSKPLGVRYRVLVDRRLVKVLRVWRY